MFQRHTIFATIHTIKHTAPKFLVLPMAVIAADMMPQPTIASRDGLPRQNSSTNSSSSAAAEQRLSRSKKRLQNILQRGQVLLCVSFAIMTFTLNMIFFAKVNGGHNIHSNISDAPIISDAPALDEEVLRRSRLKQQRLRRKHSKGMIRTQLYNSTRYTHGSDLQSLRRERRHNKALKTSHNEQHYAVDNTRSTRVSGNNKSTGRHPRVVCFFANGYADLSDEYLPESDMESIPIDIGRSNTQPDDVPSSSEEGGGYIYDTANVKGDNCRYSRSIEERSRLHPTCNDIHSVGFNDQMFDKDYSGGGYNIDFLAVGGANSVWKATSTHNGESAILKTTKMLKFYTVDRLKLYVLDAMIAAKEGNPQLSTQLRSENAVSNALSSEWNHIMPVYSHCYAATIAPVASGTLKDYVTNYPDEHDGETIDPLDKLRLALQAARGLYQMQMYRYGKPTFAHFDLNPSQFLVFHPRKQSSSNIPILQINDFNRGRFLHWDTNNNTCTFQFDGCDKNTRGSRWHGPDRFIGCIDVNEKVDTFTLGGVFFFLLSDGETPFGDTRYFGDFIKEGKLPSLPKSAVSDHPAFDALSEMAARCRALRIEDRPSSLEVVNILEEKLRKIESGF